jgi:hypothetical protein
MLVELPIRSPSPVVKKWVKTHVLRPNPNIPQFCDVDGYKSVTVLAQNERGPALRNTGRRWAGPTQEGGRNGVGSYSNYIKTLIEIRVRNA